MFWTGRAITEVQQSARTLLGTFTMSPDEHYLLDARAQVRVWNDGKGIDFSKLSPAEIFSERARQFGIELQKWLKRVRKGDANHVKPAIRYLLICEEHNSAETSVEMRGRPHFHILLHEGIAGTAVIGNPVVAIEHGSDGEYERRMYKTRHGWKPGAFAKDDAFIRSQWEFGFTKFQFAETVNAAVYPCKYLTKAIMARVRASYRYGLREDGTSQAQRPGGKVRLDRSNVKDDPDKRPSSPGAPIEGSIGAQGTGEGGSLSGQGETERSGFP